MLEVKEGTKVQEIASEERKERREEFNETSQVENKGTQLHCKLQTFTLIHYRCNLQIKIVSFHVKGVSLVSVVSFVSQRLPIESRVE